MSLEKLQRTTEDYGSGSGVSGFCGDMFRVVNWKHVNNRCRTTIEYNFRCHPHFHVDEMAFDGVVDFESDEDCFNQLEVSDITKMLKIQYALGHKSGRLEKLNEIQDALGIMIGE